MSLPQGLAFFLTFSRKIPWFFTIFAPFANDLELCLENFHLFSKKGCGILPDFLKKNPIVLMIFPGGKGQGLEAHGGAIPAHGQVGKASGGTGKIGRPR